MDERAEAMCGRLLTGVWTRTGLGRVRYRTWRYQQRESLMVESERIRAWEAGAEMVKGSRNRSFHGYGGKFVGTLIHNRYPCCFWVRQLLNEKQGTYMYISS